jgi:hypothetical protein
MLLGDTAASLLFLPGHDMPHGVSVPQRSPDVRTTMVIREHDCWKGREVHRRLNGLGAPALAHGMKARPAV